MKSLKIVIYSTVAALFLIMSSISTAWEKDQEVVVFGYCDTTAPNWSVSVIDDLLVALRGDAESYYAWMALPEVPCIDHRIAQIPPLRAKLLDYQYCMKVHGDSVSEFWTFTDKGGAVGWTWVPVDQCVDIQSNN